MTSPEDPKDPTAADNVSDKRASRRSRRVAVSWLAASAAYTSLFLLAAIPVDEPDGGLVLGMLLWFTWPLPVVFLAVSAVGSVRPAARGGVWYRAALLASAVPFAHATWTWFHG